jgi:tetratricopeptide (TPR) repeat protein
MRDAVDLYVKGRVAFLVETIPSLNNAIEYFERAVEIDGDNPLNWIALADAYCRMAFQWDPEGGWYQRAKEISERATQLDPEIPEGRYIRARLAWTPQGGFQHELAIRELVAALAERPNLFEGFNLLATILWHVGLIEDARLNYQRALAINPDDMVPRTYLVTCELMTGNYEVLQPGFEALEGVETSWALYLKAFWQLHIGDFEGAERTIEEASRKFPAHVLFHSARAMLAAKKGDEAAALLAIERTLQNRKQYGHSHHAEMEIGCVLAILEKKHEALDRLTSAVHGGFPCPQAVENDPLLSTLRSEKRYRELIDELRASQQHYRQLYDDLRGAISLG